jgi:predicted sugar kinase
LQQQLAIKLKEKEAFHNNEKDLLKKMHQMEIAERDEIIKKQLMLIRENAQI